MAMPPDSSTATSGIKDSRRFMNAPRRRPSSASFRQHPDRPILDHLVVVTIVSSLMTIGAARDDLDQRVPAVIDL